MDIARQRELICALADLTTRAMEKSKEPKEAVDAADTALMLVGEAFVDIKRIADALEESNKMHERSIALNTHVAHSHGVDVSNFKS
jgi:hypothetical protein